MRYTVSAVGSPAIPLQLGMARRSVGSSGNHGTTSGEKRLACSGLQLPPACDWAMTSTSGSPSLTSLTAFETNSRQITP